MKVNAVHHTPNQPPPHSSIHRLFVKLTSGYTTHLRFDLRSVRRPVRVFLGGRCFFPAARARLQQGRGDLRAYVLFNRKYQLELDHGI